MTDRPYAAHESLVAPARKRAEIWRLLAGLVLIAIITFGLNAALQAVVYSAAPIGWAADLATGHRPGPMLVLLGSFGFVIVAVFAAAHLVQRRAPLGLIGMPGLALTQFWRVLRLLVLLGLALLILPPYDMGVPLVPNLPVARWLILLPLALVAILIQTSAEEILFRGYLQQALAARFAHPSVWLILPSALFALGHFVPAEAGANAGLVAIWAGCFGLLMADLTARAGTLGPAIAVHFFNNITALLIFALPESLNGLSLFILPFSSADTGLMRAWLAVDFVLMVLTWLVARIAIRR
ncbi:CPBP family intramembrane glutamic endopeptidase [Antarcticimicrobium luteum]|uniref:CPBP family intramembrane metalloprotease n=1 Tax=Antarcticimicrobium luteum TaxID=2547397 RepID=A0A4R5V522_9RHOB|nr:CPBP family intramembrane glutamic endopeptidase [Antarcticimicrobium luteum]TDK46841.1 CPBP family intramembrane metalloprotease [Antarcticimicrobium luteum]